jgi:hypothetical protein
MSGFALLFHLSASRLDNKDLKPFHRRTSKAHFLHGRAQGARLGAGTGARTYIYNGYFLRFFFPRFLAARSSITACAPASRAIGTLNGDALT